MRLARYTAAAQCLGALARLGPPGISFAPPRHKRLALRMQRQERSVALEIMRGAFAAIWLPFTWAAEAPAAVVALVRRATRSRGEPGQAAHLARLNTGKWTRELLKHL